LSGIRCLGEKPQTLSLSRDGRPARWTILLGENGTGKTTILQALAGVEPIPSRAGRAGLKRREDLAPRLVFPPLQRPSALAWSDFSRTEDRRGSIQVSVGQGQGFGQEEEWTRVSSEIGIDGGTLSCPAGSRELVGLRCYGYGASRRLSDSHLSGLLEDDPVGSLFLD
jgi:hypothetical protein